MPTNPDSAAPADLIAGIRAPWHVTVGECLRLWGRLGPVERSTSYIVLRCDDGVRQTLNASAIAELVGRCDEASAPAPANAAVATTKR